MKAIALLSGGLDSSLAIKLVQNQGIEVIAVHFLIPFCKQEKIEMVNSSIKKMAKDLDVELVIKRLGEKYLNIVKNPKYGYGKNLNPCIDCKIFMFKLAKKIMQEKNAKFIISGEVLGQRPMSQNKQSLGLIERDSDLEGFILRPLSAKLLAQTLPEKKRWIKRDDLMDISGRTRKIQINLAEQLAIKDYPWPGGGCLLTEINFCRRLKDIFKYNEYSLYNVELLKLGRHFRLSPQFKLVIGRDKTENEKLLKLADEKDLYFEPNDLPGPVGIGRGEVNEKIKRLAAQMIARYVSVDTKVKVAVGIIGEERKEMISTKGIDEKLIKELMV